MSFLACQVVADYVSEIDFAMCDEAPERAVRDPFQARVDRQLVFLKRKDPAGAADHKPRKRFPRSAFQVLIGPDNQATGNPNHDANPFIPSS